MNVQLRQKPPRSQSLPEDAAAAIHDLVVVNMAAAVREVSVDKGHDPREFLFLAYGGTLPMFAVQIAEQEFGDEVGSDIATVVKLGLEAYAADTP